MFLIYAPPSEVVSTQSVNTFRSFFRNMKGRVCLLVVAFAIFFDIVHGVIADRRRLEVELHWHIELKLIIETRFPQ